MIRLKSWFFICSLILSFKTQAQELDCNSYLARSETPCQSLGQVTALKNQAHLYDSIDKTIVLNTLKRMISRAKSLLDIEIGSLEKYIDDTRLRATKNANTSVATKADTNVAGDVPTSPTVEYGYSQVLSHTLAICERFQKKTAEKEPEELNNTPTLLLEISLLQDPQIKPWLEGEGGKQAILKETPTPACPVQLAQNRQFLTDFNIAMTEKKNHLIQRITAYENMEKKIQDTPGDSFAVLHSDTEVFLDMFIFTDPSKEPPGNRQRCKYFKVLSSIKRSEGFKEAAKESATNVASLLVGPETLVLGTLGKATASLGKIENLLQRLYVMSKDGKLMPKDLKEMARNKGLMKELDVEEELVKDIPEFIFKKYNVGYGELLEKIGLSRALERSAAASTSKTIDTHYRNLLVQEAQTLAKKGVSLHPKSVSRIRAKELLDKRDIKGNYTPEYLVSNGVYPNQPKLLLDRIQKEFGSFQKFVDYMGKNSR